MATSSPQPRCCWAEPGEAGRRVTRTTSSSRGGRRGMLFLLGCVGAYPCASARTPLSTTLSGQVHQVSLRKTLREGKIVQAVAKAAERRVSRLSGDPPSCPHTTGHLLCLCGRVFNFWAGKGCVGAAGAGRECRQPGQAAARGMGTYGYGRCCWARPSPWLEEHQPPLALLKRPLLFTGLFFEARKAENSALLPPPPPAPAEG